MKSYVAKTILAIFLVALLCSWLMPIGQASAQGATATLSFDNTTNQVSVTVKSPTGVTRAQVVVDVPSEITMSNTQLSGFMKDAVPLSNGTERRWVQMSGNGETQGSVAITIASPKGITSTIKLVSVGLKDVQENAIPVTLLATSVQIAPTNTPTSGTMNWSFYLLIALLAVAVGVILFLVLRKPLSLKTVAQTLTDHAPSKETKASPSTVVAPEAKASLMLPDGNSIPLAGSSKLIGRPDFQSALPIDKLVNVSRRHLWITLENNEYYAEDKNSGNGTLLNKVEIKGKGKQLLRNGDKIELGGAVTVDFKTG
jgi:hypothetical protein